MSLNISDFKYIEHFFGDIIDTMANDFLTELFDKEYSKNILEKFDTILEILNNSNSGIDKIIENFKKSKEDFYRFNSLISEIKAGYYFHRNGCPVKFIEVEEGKTPDIESEIDGIKTYIEVKSISEKTFQFEKISEELNKTGIPYDVALYVQNRFYNASDVIKEFLISFNQIDKKKITNEFSAMINYKFGQFEVRNKKGEKPVYMPIISYTLPQSKQDKKKFFDAYTSSEEIESGIKGALEKAVQQLNNFSKDEELCFTFLNNLDVRNYSLDEFYNFLYGGKEIFCLPEPGITIDEANSSYNNGWFDILYQLGFLRKYMDYSKKNGWFIFSEEAKFLNGIFYCEDRYFSSEKVHCFLNPFLNKNKSYTKLENILPYYIPKIQKNTRFH